MQQQPEKQDIEVEEREEPRTKKKNLPECTDPYVGRKGGRRRFFTEI